MVDWSQRTKDNLLLIQNCSKSTTLLFEGNSKNILVVINGNLSEVEVYTCLISEIQQNKELSVFL